MNLAEITPKLHTILRIYLVLRQKRPTKPEKSWTNKEKYTVLLSRQYATEYNFGPCTHTPPSCPPSHPSRHVLRSPSSTPPLCACKIVNARVSRACSRITNCALAPATSPKRQSKAGNQWHSKSMLKCKSQRIGKPVRANFISGHPKPGQTRRHSSMRHNPRYLNSHRLGCITYTRCHFVRTRRQLHAVTEDAIHEQQKSNEAIKHKGERTPHEQQPTWNAIHTYLFIVSSQKAMKSHIVVSIAKYRFRS